jgi:23S rRNA pseudouridine1911/1915/1917 synthase
MLEPRSSEYFEIKVEPDNQDIGKRLDLFLSITLPQYSRSFIKKTIETNKVLLNGEVCYKAGYKVHADDLISFPNLNFEFPSQKLEATEFDLEIILEDDDYLFINKPIGLTVHPTNPSETNTLVNKILGRYKDLPSKDFLRPGIVHRLDKDTSGLIVIAKNSKSLWWLSSRFADRKVNKTYISIGLANNLSKAFLDKEIELEGYLSRNPGNRKEFVFNNNEVNKNSRFSKTSFEILDTLKLAEERFLIYSKVHPHTGRTHQIRVHQRFLGDPILGDRIYSSRKELAWINNWFEKNNLEKRLYLHSFSISFENYDGKLYSVETQIPQSFNKVIEYAKKADQSKKTKT